VGPRVLEYLIDRSYALTMMGLAAYCAYFALTLLATWLLIRATPGRWGLENIFVFTVLFLVIHILGLGYLITHACALGYATCP
jgi:hypothetical protein